MTAQSDRIEGAPLIRPSTTDHPLYDQVVEACKTVFDPEIPVNIYDLGLIYTIDISPENEVNVIMTLTAPGCPVPARCRAGWPAQSSPAGRQAGRRRDDVRAAVGHGHDVRRGAARTRFHVNDAFRGDAHRRPL
jgi:hypothetical protein